ncbi:hypothetical protein G6F65_022563 [Rhizopus arrhizus]|nr:hypothetical protein G6F65_022563 [Rhizopus arrhizus]
MPNLSGSTNEGTRTQPAGKTVRRRPQADGRRAGLQVRLAGAVQGIHRPRPGGAVELARRVPGRRHEGIPQLPAIAADLRVGGLLRDEPGQRLRSCCHLPLAGAGRGAP